MEDKIFIKIEVDGVQVDKEVKTLKDLKIARKQFTDEVIAGNEKALVSLAKVQDKLEDIQEAAGTVKGSGVEKLTASFRLLGEGVGSFDFDKIKVGFQGIGAAMKAVPIFLIIEGIRLLIENFDEVVKFIGDFIGVTKDSEAAVKKLVEQMEIEAQAIKNLITANDEYTKNQLLQAQALGASEEELEEKTRKSLFRKLESLKKYYAESVDIYNKLAKEEASTDEQLKDALKKVDDAKEQVRKAGYELSNFQLQTQINFNKRLDEADAELEKKRKAAVERYKKFRAEMDKNANDTFANSISEEQRILDIEGKAIDDRQKARDAQRIAGAKAVADQEKALRDAAVAEAEANAEKQKALDKQVADTKVQIQNTSFQAAKGLSDLFFQIQENGAQGNAKKLNEIAKKKFAVDKAFNIAQATIDGIRSVQAALTIPPPFGQILAAANGILAFANVGKIASVQFNGTASAPSVDTSSSIPSPPPPPPPPAGVSSGNSTLLTQTSNQQSQPMSAIVVETQLSDVQQRVGLIQKRSIF